MLTPLYMLLLWLWLREEDRARIAWASAPERAWNIQARIAERGIEWQREQYMRKRRAAAKVR